MNEARYALRQLRKTPGFTAVALLTLTVGIGACTAIFSVVNKVLLQPLPNSHPEQLVRIREADPPDLPSFSVSPGDLLDWSARSATVSQFASFFYDVFNLTGSGDPVRLVGYRVSANYLSVVGPPPAMGRDFSPGEDTQGRGDVAIISEGLWKRQFGGRADIVGQVIRLNGAPTTVIGVLPASYHGPDVLMPMVLTPEARTNHGNHYMQVIARMKPGVTAAQAGSELKVIAADLAKKYPDTNKGWTTLTTPLLDDTVGAVRPQLLALLAAVGLLLLIGCANVANLLLVRAAARSKEIAVRAAIGASRARLVRQLVVENLVLALLGGAGGAVSAYWAVQLLLRLAPAGVPRSQEVAVDGWALAFCVALALLTGIGFGFVPALKGSRVDLNAALKDGGRGSSEGRSSHRLRNALVVSELTIALVLLVGSGLLMRTFVKLEGVDPGFRTDSAYVFNVVLPAKKYDADQKTADFAGRLAEKLARIPGVSEAGATQAFPFYSDYVLTLAIEEKKVPVEDLPSVNYYTVTPGYFKAMGIPLLKGRAFGAQDTAGSELVTIISQATAARFFPGEDPIGKRVNIQNPEGKWSTIVGVVADVKQYRLQGDAPAGAYEPFSQHPYLFQSYVLRLAGKPADLAGSIRSAVRDVDPDLPIGDVRPVESMLKDSIASQRFAMRLFMAFSAAALLLATIGIYGVMAYSVSQRRAEIGVRMALGAQSRDVLRMIAGQGARLIAVGLAGGLAGALVLTRLIASQLYGVGATDPLTLACACLVLALAASAACMLSAVRASRIDPIVALRES
jgi:putative ABC transport system permease protein